MEGMRLSSVKDYADAEEGGRGRAERELATTTRGGGDGSAGDLLDVELIYLGHFPMVYWLLPARERAMQAKQSFECVFPSSPQTGSCFM